MARRKPKPATRETRPKYTGVGSRQTPDHVLELMSSIATDLRYLGYTLRSGAADGADVAFGAGAQDQAHIYLPWSGFGHVEPGALCITQGQNIPIEQLQILAKVHPRWASLTDGPRKLHARNVRQVLGTRLDEPSDFLICWTPNGQEIGGTATAIRIAQLYGVPTFNLGMPSVFEAFRDQDLREILPYTDDSRATLPSQLPF
jgi:hypothetical protein